MLVGVEHRLAFAGLLDDRQDLLLEPALGDRLRGALVRGQGERVLVAAGDAVFRRHVLGRDAHVDAVERIVQRGQHHVDHRGVAHAGAPARAGGEVAGTAHAFGPAADGDVGIAQQDRLRGAEDRLQAGAAQPVHRQAGRVLGDAAIQRGDAGEIHVACLGVDDVAEHHMADVLAIDLGAGHRLAHHLRAECRGRHILQGAAKIPDGGTHAADHDHFALHISRPFRSLCHSVRRSVTHSPPHDE